MCKVRFLNIPIWIISQVLVRTGHYSTPFSKWRTYSRNLFLLAIKDKTRTSDSNRKHFLVDSKTSVNTFWRVRETILLDLMKKWKTKKIWKWTYKYIIYPFVFSIIQNKSYTKLLVALEENFIQQEKPWMMNEKVYWRVIFLV